MRKISFLILVGILAFSLESCSSRSSSGNKSVNTVVVTAQQDTKQGDSSQKSVKTEGEDPETKEINKAKEAKEEKVAGLIPATKPDIRVRGSIRGRQDPFAVVPIQPQIEIIEKAEPKNLKSPKNPLGTSEEISKVPTIEPETPLAELAENVLVTGLIELGDRIKLIIQAPEETSARYVEIGQYLSNGQILVKRIEPGFPEPTVILEQNGVEVAKVIGQLQEDATLEEETQVFFPFEQESITSVAIESNK